MQKRIFYLCLILFTTMCSTQRLFLVSAEAVETSELYKEKDLSNEALKDWYSKDIILDTIPGISLERAYDKIGHKFLETVTIAVIDTEIDIEHEDLANSSWRNISEIPDNGKDDDHNGYTDDYYGWNFLGNSEGENIIYSHTASLRVVRQFHQKFGNIEDPSQILDADKEEYQEYIAAKKVFERQHLSAVDDVKYGNFLVETYPKSKILLKEFFPEEDYNFAQLDSLYELHKSDEEIADLIFYMRDYLKYGLSQEFIETYKKEVDEKLSKTYNKDFNDRQILGDDPEDLEDMSYGNNLVNAHIDKFYHGTLVAGLIGANRNNAIGIKGVAEKVNILPVCISSNGAEHDKDIALAIRYAVDNGASIINMSFGKEFSLHKEWVWEAIKYAAENNVLIISSAGNTSTDLNKNKSYFPNDNIGNNTEVARNFILVGSSSHKLDKHLLSEFSNFGNTEVDIFAPGEMIYTTMPNNEYRFDSGTSLASAITSGVAALLWSYKPELKAEEVKAILLHSAVRYEREVEIVKGENKPFYSLSKSGGILNAYNALLMADEWNLSAPTAAENSFHNSLYSDQ